MKTNYKLANRVLSLVLVFVMVLSMMPVVERTVHAADVDCTKSGCEGYYLDGFCVLCGGYEKPPMLRVAYYDKVGESYFESFYDTYYATNAGHLYWFAEAVNTGEIYGSDITLYIGNDIQIGQPLTINASTGYFDGDSSLLKKWVPIGKTGSRAFQGTILGNGYSISGIYCNDDSLEVCGFVGYASRATIKDLTIKHSVFMGTTWYSSNVTVATTPTGSFISSSTKDTLINCVSYATVDTATNGVGGGLIGAATATIVDHCAFFGKAYGQSDEVEGGVGGLVGAAMNEVAGSTAGTLTYFVARNSVNLGELIVNDSDLCNAGQFSSGVTGGKYENMYYLNEGSSSYPHTVL